MLIGSDISKSYSDRTLFSGLTLNLAAGDRIALIGPNGSGKTTLMDILGGRYPPGHRERIQAAQRYPGLSQAGARCVCRKPLLEEVLDAGSEVNSLVSSPLTGGPVIGSRPCAARLSAGTPRKLDMELEAPAETTENTRPRPFSRALVLSRPTLSGL